MQVPRINSLIPIFVFTIFAVQRTMSAGRHDPNVFEGSHSRKSRTRRRDMKPLSEIENTGPTVSFEGNMPHLQKALSLTTPELNHKDKNLAVVGWTEALVNVAVPSFSDQFVRENFGKFGFHSKIKPIAGQLIHISDPGRTTHFGCNGFIANKMDIPKNKTWVALIKRGKCYFFNKIKLAEFYNASAAIIYNDRKGKTEIMNTIGTKIVSLMITHTDGHQLAFLLDAGLQVHVEIKAGKSHNSSEAGRSSELTQKLPTSIPKNIPSSFSESTVKKLENLHEQFHADTHFGISRTETNEVVVIPTSGALNLNFVIIDEFILLSLSFFFYFLSNT